jgi:hypothetical protein
VCVCRETVTLMEKKVLALDWLVKRLLSSLKNRFFKGKERLLNVKSVHTHKNYTMMMKVAWSCMQFVIEFFSINTKFVEAIYLLLNWRKEKSE